MTKVCSVICLLLLMVCLLSCSNSNDYVYTVDEAYELGLIRRDELENLADYNNR